MVKKINVLVQISRPSGLSVIYHLISLNRLADEPCVGVALLNLLSQSGLKTTVNAAAEWSLSTDT